MDHPSVDKLYQVIITERLVKANPEKFITNDKLNAMVDDQICKIDRSGQHVVTIGIKKESGDIHRP